jgi:hypothetical protein
MINKSQPFSKTDFASFRYDVGSAVLLFRELLLPLVHFAGKTDDHIMFIGFPIYRYASEFASVDLHFFAPVV